MEQGKVKFYKTDKGFGFIERDGDSDLFFHISDCNMEKEPEKGQAVQYEMGEGKKGPVAINVSPV